MSEEITEGLRPKGKGPHWYTGTYKPMWPAKITDVVYDGPVVVGTWGGSYVARFPGDKKVYFVATLNGDFIPLSKPE